MAAHIWDKYSVVLGDVNVIGTYNTYSLAKNGASKYITLFTVNGGNSGRLYYSESYVINSDGTFTLTGTIKSLSVPTSGVYYDFALYSQYYYAYAIYDHSQYLITVPESTNTYTYDDDEGNEYVGYKRNRFEFTSTSGTLKTYFLATDSECNNDNVAMTVHNVTIGTGQVKGEYQEQVSSDTKTTYPEDGILGDYYYVYRGYGDSFGKAKCASYIGSSNFAARNLPSGYTQVEYIEGTGTQYINTGFSMSKGNTKIEIDFQFTEYVDNTFIIRQYYSNDFFAIGLYSNSFYTSSNITMSQTSNMLARTTASGTASAVNMNVSLFAQSVFNGSTTSITNCCCARIYSCKIYDNGTLVRDLVPCKNSSSVAGMYDLVNSVFYTNSGTGTFTVGDTFIDNIAKQIKKIYIGGSVSNTKLLLHGDVIWDDSLYNNNIVNDGVTVSTTQSKFGGSSMYFDGSSYMSITSDIFKITKGDFTIDWWQYRENTGTLGCFNVIDSAGFSQVLIEHGGGTALYVSYAGGTWNVSSTTAFQATLNQWVHYAIVKSGTTLSIYENGVSRYQATVANSFSEGTGQILLGCHAASTNRDYFKGYIDEFRVCDVAKWTSNFTVPTSAYSSEIIPNIARLVKKVYIGDSNGFARLVFGGGGTGTIGVLYTGDYTDELEVTMDGTMYRLLTLTTSGTLTLDTPTTADVWMCSGGNGGEGAYYSTSSGPSGRGGGGGFILYSASVNISDPITCVVGSGGAGGKNGNGSTKASIGGTSSFGTISCPTEYPGVQLYNNPHYGQSGGGATKNDSHAYAAGKGMGTSTIPFNSSTSFDPHSAGGGGGGFRFSDAELDESYKVHGGNGGTNGSDGLAYASDSTAGGIGGNKGGGTGGTSSSSSNAGCNGYDATFYGSGGGGAGGYSVHTSRSSTIYQGAGGAGYQGVIYVRIPY